jgi:hypothetical protein
MIYRFSGRSSAAAAPGGRDETYDADDKQLRLTHQAFVDRIHNISFPPKPKADCCDAGAQSLTAETGVNHLKVLA